MVELPLAHASGIAPNIVVHGVTMNHALVHVFFIVFLAFCHVGTWILCGNVQVAEQEQCATINTLC